MSDPSGKHLRVIDWDRVALGIDAVRQSRGMSWRAVSRATGLGDTTPSRLANGASISADALVALFVWAGISDIRPYMKDRGEQP